MNEKKDSGAKLRLIQGGLQSEIRFNSLRIVAAPETLPPFEVDAIAFEEDTFLIMSADTQIRDPDDHIIRLMTNLIETEPELPGTVIVKGKSPFKLLAVVHDVSLEPTFKEKWIRSALHEVFKESEKRKVRSLALPMIGTLHGSLKHKRFVEFLKPAIEKTSPNHLSRIWLITPPGINKEIVEMLKSV